LFLRQSLIQTIGEDLLGEGDGAGCLGGKETRLFQSGFQSLAGWCDVIHQADAFGFRCGDHLMEKQDAPRTAHPNTRGQEMR
jgi:hypothetical protein